MTNHYIILTEKEIHNRDISSIKNLYEKLISFPDQLQKHENSIEFRFEKNIGMLDFIDHLSDNRYKEWFKKVDVECPTLPYFLSGNSFKSSLSIYFMGCVPFKKQDGKLIFDEEQSRHFLERKQHHIKNLCLGSNIIPLQTITRMNSILFGKPAEDETGDTDKKTPDKKHSLKTLIEEYGSFVYLTKDGVRAALLLDKAYELITINKAHLFTGGEKPVLRIYYSLNNNKIESDATIIDLQRIVKAKEKNETLTLVFITNSNNEFHRFFDEKLPSFDITDETAPPLAKREENSPPETKEEEKTPPTIEEKLILAQEENKTLRQEIKSLNATIDAMEEDKNAPRFGIGSLFRKLFK